MVNSTAYARYVGRVGALAVVLGVGVAVATGGSGLAWADPGSTGGSQSAGASAGDDSDTSSAQGAGGDPAAPSTASGSTGDDGVDGDAPEADDSAGDEPVMNFGNSGSVDTSVNDAGQSTDTVPTDDASEELDESELAVAPESDADAEEEIDAELVGQKDGELDRREGTFEVLSPETAANQQKSSSNDTTSRTQAEDAGPIADVAPVVEDAADLDADEATEQEVGAESLTSQVMPAVENAGYERQVSTTLAGDEPDAAPTSTGVPGTFVDVASAFVTALLSPFLAPSPVAPAEPPLAWALLAFARREWHHMLLNRTPTAVVDAVTTSEDTPITVDVVTGTDPDAVAGDVVTVTEVTQPQHGTVTLEGGRLTYTPDRDFHGTDTFTYTISDEESPLHIHGLRGLFALVFGGDAGHAETVTVTVNVNPVNDAPVAVDDAVTVDEDSGTIVIDVLGNDTDIDGDELTVSAAGAAGNGTVTLVDGAVTYTPDTDFHGTDSFTYTVSDGNGGTASATVTVTVTAVQDPPAPSDDAYTTDEDTPLTIPAPGVLGNDIDVDGDDLSAHLIANPLHGTLTLNADGSFTYTPFADFHGTDTFTYAVSDGNGGITTATVHITVNSVNDAPVANPDSVSTNEDTPVAVDVLGNDSDVDGDELSVTAVGAADNGTVTLDDGVITYTPNTGFYGSDRFTYTIDDGNGGTATAAVNLTVNKINTPPVANDDFVSTEQGRPVVIDVLRNDFDPDTGDHLAVILIEAPLYGIAELDDDGTITYTPHSGFIGRDTITYQIHDGTDASEIATVQIEVRQRPIGAPDIDVITDEDTPAYIDILVDDPRPGGGTPIAIKVDAPENGVVEVRSFHSGRYTVIYTPAPDFVGTDSFTYILESADGRISNPGTVTITVNPVNDAPVAVDDAVTVDENSAVVVVDVLANDSDVDDDELTVVEVSEAQNGVVALTDGVVTYRPNTDFDGTDSFTYTVADGNGGAASATVTVTVKDADTIAFDDGAQPSQTFVSRDRLVYVLTGDELRIVDSATREWVSTVDLGATPSAFTVSRDGRYAYVATSTWSDVAPVTKIELATGLSTRIGAARQPSAMAVSADGDMLYVTSDRDSTVSVIDTETGRYRFVDIGVQSRAIAVSEDGETLYVGTVVNDVRAVDVPTGEYTVVYEGPRDEMSVADLSITVVDRFTYVTDGLNDRVVVIETDYKEVVAVYDGIGPHPTSVTATPYGEVILVASRAENSVTVLSLELGVLGAIPVGANPTDVDFAVDDEVAYVTTREGISIISVEDIAALFDAARVDWGAIG